ncbi:6530_t:CDS:2 [Ambispora gerdemannii]|uniref:6530_t:CDS:1 n=1 Tax=Ambispora gerdemannii TaxID=144530 RepID=A0A9N9C458_9GLOM|nr:6530_t:CDS:2 [Ambispora gerdemannii]
MKYIFAVFVVLLAITYVPYSEAACAAQLQQDSCVSTLKNAINSCVATDYGCLCQKYKDLRVCYNQCPSDPQSKSDAAGVDGSITTYCIAASDASSRASATQTSSTSSGTSKATPSAATTSNAQTTGTSTDSAKPSASGTKNAATNLNSHHLLDAFCFVTTFIASLLI